jgi:hypothetical protein
MSICGMNEQTVRSAISVPEWVLSVRYQTREKDVTEVPNCDIPWHEINATAFFFQGEKASIVPFLFFDGTAR